MSNTGVFFSSLSNHRESVKVQQEHLQNSAARRSCFASRRKNFTVRRKPNTSRNRHSSPPATT